MRTRRDERAGIDLEQIGERTSAGGRQLREREELGPTECASLCEAGRAKRSGLPLRFCGDFKRQNFEIDRHANARPARELVEVRLVAARDSLDDVTAVIEVGDPHDARGIGDSGVDGVIEGDLLANIGCKTLPAR